MVNANCQSCGKEYRIRPCSVGVSKFCSRSCYHAFRTGKAIGPRGSNAKSTEFKTIRVCDHCGADFIIRSGSDRFCLTCAPDKKASTILNTYGISAVDHQRLRARQDDRCAICCRSVPNNAAGKKLAVDHDHTTGVVRGLGNFFDDAALLEQAITYLKLSGSLPKARGTENIPLRPTAEA